MNEDINLLKAAANGDNGAFEQLVRKYKASVFNTIYSMIGNAQDAEDIAQDVFIKVYRSADRFRGDAAFSTWLYRITVNRCLDAAKSRKKLMVSLEAGLGDGNELTLNDLLKSDEDSLEIAAQKKELRARVQRLLLLLPENYRMALVLKEFEGLSYDEIAGIMGISTDQVRTWLYRARQGLKEQLRLSAIQEVSSEMQ